MAATINGRRKCKAKNRFKVAISANPPHNHYTIVIPKYGMADTKFVIIVASRRIFDLMVKRNLGRLFLLLRKKLLLLLFMYV